jgi:transcription initiation factor TFIIIB Brf1 subunit/transcription initiation factor TFIIB
MDDQFKDIFDECESLYHSSEKKRICEHCGSSKFFKDMNNVVCGECFVIFNNIKYNTKSYENEHSAKNILFKDKKTNVNVSGKLGYSFRNIYSWQRNTPHKEKVNKKLYDDMRDRYTKYAKKKGIKVNNHIITKTIIIFRLINKYNKINRGKLKMGVLARCFYFASKDLYIIWSKTELCELFDIQCSYLTKGKSIVNNTCRNCDELKEHINMDPIMALDILDKIQDKFPSLKDKDVVLLRKFVSRVQDDEDVIKNTPRAIVAGILSLFVQIFKKKSITMSNIISQLAVSSSSIKQYSKKFEWLIYDPSTY